MNIVATIEDLEGAKKSMQNSIDRLMIPVRRKQKEIEKIDSLIARIKDGETIYWELS